MKSISIPVIVLMICAVLASDASAQRRIGVALEHDSTSSISTTAGETIPFLMHALDDQGHTVKDWPTVGVPLTLTVAGSRALTDSSSRSWNTDPDGYSWLRIALNDSSLTLDSITTGQGDIRLFYTIPPGAFSAGRASLTFAQSRADTGITLSLAPRWSALRQDSPPIRILPATHAGYLVDLTSAVPDSDAVYLLRLYEVIVTPRDRFLNTIADRVIPTEFTARFPGEFANIPGTTRFLDATVDITGDTAVYLASRISRGDTNSPELQWIRVYSPSDSAAAGQTNPYAVLDHAPHPVSLTEPADESYVELRTLDPPIDFSWEKPVPADPYHNVIVSRFDSLTTSSDDIRYEIVFLDEETLTHQIRYDADDSAHASTWSAAPEIIYSIMEQLSKSITIKIYTMIWFVSASDGLYQTKSLPPIANPDSPGFRLSVEKVSTYDVSPLPETAYVTLHQNYPNPFHLATVIPVGMHSAGNVRVRVFNVLGEEIALLHDGMLAPGEHHFRFDDTGLPSGVYRYQLDMEGKTVSRSMLLLR